MNYLFYYYSGSHILTDILLADSVEELESQLNDEFPTWFSWEPVEGSPFEALRKASSVIA